MQRNNRRIGLAAFAVCLLVALAFGGLSAFANASWQGEGFENSLTVQAVNPADDMASDLEGVDVVVDIYRIASAERADGYDAYNYTWAAPFGEGAIPSSWFEVPTKSEWSKKALPAAQVLGEALDEGQTVDSVTADVGTKIENLDAGIYLVLAHGKSEPVTFDESGTPILKAYSELYEYTFAPELVAVPSKEADENGVIRTDDSYGPWLSDVTAVMKPNRAPLYGSLRIDKKVVGVTGNVEPASFVFHISGTTPDGKAYDNYAQVYYSGGESAYTIVKHIPAGTVVRVSESYEGARYKLVRSDDEEKVIVADRWVTDNNPMAYAEFENEPTGGPGGHGIENKFELFEDGDWHWTSIPDQSANAPRE